MKMNGFPSGEARHLVGIRENGDDAWHHLRLVLHLTIYRVLCIQQVVFCWISEPGVLSEFKDLKDLKLLVTWEKPESKPSEEDAVHCINVFLCFSFSPFKHNIYC